MRKDGENGRKSDRRGRIRKKYRSGENKWRKKKNRYRL